MSKVYDYGIIGAGAFGAWTAYFLRRSGASVVLIDAYGAANSRASSGGETRVIRMGYGPDELYTRWAMRSLQIWYGFSESIGKKLFHKTGVLWLSDDSDQYLKSQVQVLGKAAVPFETLASHDIQQRWPQLRFNDIAWAILEPESGVLMARSSVQALVAELMGSGVEYQEVAALPPQSRGRVASVQTSAGDPISAGTFIYACGPWLPKIFPELLRERIYPTRQEVFFLGTPRGSRHFKPPQMPVWLHRTHIDLPYALPDIEGRGFKIAFDRHGEMFDPDCSSRVIPSASIERLRDYLKSHIPELEDAPILETRVCQYENTWNGDFLIDRHPEHENVWIAGGGSGHGFKHGPAIGEYVVARILHDAPGEPRFALETKRTIRKRAVY
jgi:monomeric sarcosine oxidase